MFQPLLRFEICSPKAGPLTATLMWGTVVVATGETRREYLTCRRGDERPAEPPRDRRAVERQVRSRPCSKRTNPRATIALEDVPLLFIRDVPISDQDVG
jgi:hypothetical protein